MRPVANSGLSASGRGRTKRPRFKDKDLERLTEFDTFLSLDRHYRLGWGAVHGGAYIEDEDETLSISTFSTNATMDDNPGTGRTIDMRFYQPVGRAIEKFALRIAIRLNICHPPPAQILRFLQLRPGEVNWYGGTKKLSCVIDNLSKDHTMASVGILSLVQQSQ